MPQIPFQAERTVLPEQVGVTLRSRATPEAFGAEVGMGMRQLGGTVGQVGDMLAQHAIVLQGLQNEARAKDQHTSMDSEIVDMMFNPKDGYMTKLGREAVESYPDIFNKTQEVLQKHRQALPNEEARRLFDRAATATIDHARMTMASHAAQQNKVWMISSSEARISNLQDVGAAFWNDEKKWGQVQQAIRQEAIQLAEIKGESLDSMNQGIRHYQSQAWVARLRAVTATDPEQARVMFDTGKENMTDEDQARMLGMIESHQYTRIMRLMAMEQRMQTKAEHELKQKQDGNLAKFLSDIEKGTIPSGNQLADALASGDIATHALATIRSAIDNRGTDNPIVLAMAAQGANNGTLTAREVQKYVEDGSLRGGTASTLINHLSAINREGKNQEREGYLSALRSALGGHALQMGMLDFNKQADKDHAALIARAEAEYTERTVIKKESPREVYADMIGRYQPMTFGIHGVPRSRYGDIGSHEEAVDKAKKLEDDVKAKRISPDDARREREIIGEHARILQDQQRRKKQAEEALKNGPQPEEEKGKVRGLKER